MLASAITACGGNNDNDAAANTSSGTPPGTTNVGTTGTNTVATSGTTTNTTSGTGAVNGTSTDTGTSAVTGTVTGTGTGTGNGNGTGTTASTGTTSTTGTTPATNTGATGTPTNGGTNTAGTTPATGGTNTAGTTPTTGGTTPITGTSSTGTASTNGSIPTNDTTPTTPFDGTIATSDNPSFGDKVKIYDASTPAATIQADMDAASKPQEMNPKAQFGNQRFAFLFKPGTYTALDGNLGFYTAVSGLGKSPDDVQIVGDLNADYGWNYGDSENVTQNFWRSIENLKITPQRARKDGVRYAMWAVSQAAPMRRVHVAGDLRLFPTNIDWGGSGWASGGYLADSKVDGTILAGSQQQWYTRDSSTTGWKNGAWNVVSSGLQGAPAQNFSGANSDARFTTLASTPISREKPFVYFEGGKYFVFNPALRTNSAGNSWATGTTAGTAIPMSKFYVALPSDSTTKLNAALAKGLSLILTPGIYNLTETLKITSANTIVLGIGFPTLVPNNGVDGVSVADVDGVRFAGVLFDAGTTNSNALLTVGVNGSNASHAANPTTLQDVFFRIGGAVAGKATNSLIVNSNDVIIDHIWAWRADHGILPTGWNVNTADYGVVVNGNNVLATGLFVEHFQKYDVLWNGNNGKTIFFQNEKAYDVPTQAQWSSGAGLNGYAAYKVADNVTSHEGWGMGSYCYMTLDTKTSNHIKVSHSFEVPKVAGVKFHDLVTVSLNGFGEITHIINDQGETAADDSAKTVPHLLPAYP